MGYILIEIYEVLNWSENTSNDQKVIFKLYKHVLANEDSS